MYALSDAPHRYAEGATGWSASIMRLRRKAIMKASPLKRIEADARRIRLRADVIRDTHVSSSTCTDIALLDMLHRVERFTDSIIEAVKEERDGAHDDL